MKPACSSEIFLRCQRVNEIQHSVDVQRGCPLWIYLVNLLIIPSCKILCTCKKLRKFTGSTGNFLCKSSFTGTGSQLEDVCQFPWNPHSFQQQNSRSCMVWRLSGVFQGQCIYFWSGPIFSTRRWFFHNSVSNPFLGRREGIQPLLSK